MTGFHPAIIENGTYKRIKIESINSGIRTGLAGPDIERIIEDAEEKGFLSIPIESRNMKQYISLRNTFLARQRMNNRVNVEVFVDEKWKRAFACFDTISLHYSERKFLISSFILETELETYYNSLEKIKKRRLSLPADMNPYTRSEHKTNYFILPKQICFSFYQDHPEIFFFVLNKIVKQKND